MLFEFNPTPGDSGELGLVSNLLAPLSTAARDHRPIEESVLGIVRKMGFSSVDYGTTTARTLDRDSRFFSWTTLPQQWLAHYDRNSYVEIDPRVADRWSNPTPLIWDRRIAGGRSDVATFLDYAATFAIGSGVAVFFRDEHFSRTMFSVHGPERELGPEQVAARAAFIPGILMLAFEFHSIFRRQFISAGVPPRQQGAPLSPREIQCLQLAAYGMTSRDIGQKLNLAERTVNFHFCNIISKLAAANRAEAIAASIDRKIISARP